MALQMLSDGSSCNTSVNLEGTFSPFLFKVAKATDQKPGTAGCYQMVSQRAGFKANTLHFKTYQACLFVLAAYK